MNLLQKLSLLRGGLPAWLILIATALGACSIGGGTVPANHFYRLELGSVERLPEAAISGVVEVERLAASGPLVGRPILYTQPESPLEVKQYTYHLWSKPAGVMLQELLVDYLRQANAAERVITPEMRIRTDYEIRGRVLRMEQHLGPASQVILEMELTLLDEARRKPVFNVYREDVAAADRSPAAAVAAFNTASRRIFERFLADINDANSK